MIFGRHKLDKYGEALIGTDPFLRQDALAQIQKWRETHLFVLAELNKQLKAFFAERGIGYDFQSMRIKRMTSIEAKLRNNAKGRMKLGGMQDIGGIRYVFGSIADVDKANEALGEFVPSGFDVKRKSDYIAEPKPSGYRSIHFVYQYTSDNDAYNGISIELQIRTRLQHAWAMAVETASLTARTTLKADIGGAEDWRGFFRLVSALFAKEEGKPVHGQFAGYDKADFCREYYAYKKKKLVDQLEALRVTTSNANFDNEDKGFCVLIIDFENRLVHAKIFRTEDADAAAQTFGNIETTITENEAALMVAIERIKEIREAYPSYFLDTKAFLEYLYKFDEECKLI